MRFKRLQGDCGAQVGLQGSLGYWRCSTEEFLLEKFIKVGERFSREPGLDTSKVAFHSVSKGCRVFSKVIFFCHNGLPGFSDIGSPTVKMAMEEVFKASP